MTAELTWNDDDTLTLARPDADGGAGSITADAQWWLDTAVQLITMLPSKINPDGAEEPLLPAEADPETIGRLVAQKIRNLTGQVQ